MPKFFFILIFLLFVGFFLWQEIYLPKDSYLKENKLFLVQRGQNLFQIGENLEKEGLIKNSFYFNLYTLIKGGQRKLQAGEYTFSSSMSIAEITNKIIFGDVAKMIITIPEGFTVSQIEERLNLKLPGEDLEGFLFPDTYEFPLSVSGERVVKKMMENFDKKLASYQNDISDSGKTLFEIITMASLLEKEVKTFEDKKLVSGILWKRRENGMPLQVDATINYITGKQTPKVLKEDTEIDSPYNTYKYLGLPLGPICNPGLESIKAALYPESSEYWYYLSTPEGETIFNETLKEHNYDKSKYLK
jgi:UPF0755 protein